MFLLFLKLYSNFRFLSDNMELEFWTVIFLRFNIFFIPVFNIMNKDHVVQLFTPITILQCWIEKFM